MARPVINQVGTISRDNNVGNRLATADQRGALGGSAIAELASGQASPLAAAIIAEGPPRKLYPEPLQTLGARAKLWWMQKRAGPDL